MEELAKASGLKPAFVYHGKSDSRLVYSQIVDSHGEEMG
jgi:hypothetical protein